MRKLAIIAITIIHAKIFCMPIETYITASLGSTKYTTTEDDFTQIFNFSNSEVVKLKQHNAMTARVAGGIKLLNMFSIESGISALPPTARVYENTQSEINKIYSADIMCFLNIFNLDLGVGYTLTHFKYEDMSVTDENNNDILSWSSSSKYFADPKLEIRLNIPIDNDMQIFISIAHLFGFHYTFLDEAQYQPGISTVSVGIKF